MNNYIVYHDSCMDGFISGLLMKTFLNFKKVSNIIMFPSNYGDKPVNAKPGDTLWIVDFSYPSTDINHYLNNGVNVGIYDHHETSIKDLIANINKDEDVEDLIKKERSLINYCSDCSGSGLFGRLIQNEKEISENKRSGAGLVLEHIKESLKDDYDNFLIKIFQDQKESFIRTINLAQTYDLWLHDGDFSHPAVYLSFWFNNWYKSNKDVRQLILNNQDYSCFNFDTLSKLFFNVCLEEKLHKGQELVENTINLIHEECKKVVTVKLKDNTLFDHLKIGFIPGDGPKTLGISMTGSILLKEFGYDIAIMKAVDRDDKIVYSLRSDQNGKNINVAHICKMYYESGLALTGGGHRNAAGVTFKRDFIFFEEI